MEIIFKDKEFMHSISSEALHNLTNLIPIWFCLGKTGHLEEVVKDQILVDRLTSRRIGFLLDQEEVTILIFEFSACCLKGMRKNDGSGSASLRLEGLKIIRCWFLGAELPF